MKRPPYVVGRMDICEHCSYWGKRHRWGLVWDAGWRGKVWQCACGAVRMVSR